MSVPTGTIILSMSGLAIIHLYRDSDGIIGAKSNRYSFALG